MKARYLAIGSVAALILGIVLVMLNHRHAVVTARSIIVKDQNGDIVAPDLAELKKFTGSHMRTGVTLELTASYDRAVEAAKAAAAPKVSPAIYQQAQAACAGHKVATVQTKCVADYVSNHAPATSKPVALPNKSSFTYTYKSPGWTPDIAGILLIVGTIGLVASGWLAIFNRRAR